ncbi:MAG TPA: bifunctional pyr operon transcriptional regulator/uracil phosphoribosyltransferase, partial [bacterium]|nr:bifunctional pyr operon transcriptional regulator/uracil phosphoribosyltransferase [bacterium]
MEKTPKTNLLDAKAISRTLTRLAHEILENVSNLEKVRIIGIRDRGDVLAKRLAEIIQHVEGVE